MELFQILDCSTLGTCCNDYSVIGILAVTKRIFGLVQFLVPFILIIAGTIQFVQLSINPELKDGFRRVLNKFIAAVIIFMLPVLIDAVLTAAPETFSVSACWKQVDISKVDSIFGGKYTAPDDSFWLNPTLYEEKLKSIKIVSGGGSGSTTSLRQQIVSYAVSFVGNKYVYGGRWNGELPYTPTDCIGFVKGIYTHFGFKKMKNAPNGTQSFYKYINSHKDVVTKISKSELQPGDIYLWKGHIAIYIGNGKIVHAAGKKKGVKIGNAYTGDTFRGYYRVNGVD